MTLCGDVLDPSFDSKGGTDIGYVDAGDSALVVDFGRKRDLELSRRIFLISEALSNAGISGYLESVPAFSSLTIFYDPLTLDREKLVEIVEALRIERFESAETARSLTIPVIYGGPDTDLSDISTELGLAESDVIRLHSSAVYHVYMLGFLPGFAYLGDLPEALVLPRQKTPRVRLPAGSVAIAAEMTAVYPLESPGGWNLIGSTPIPLWNMMTHAEPLLSPGDEVRFHPIDAAEAEVIRGRVREGWLPDFVEGA